MKCFVVNEGSSTVQEIDLKMHRVVKTFSANLFNPQQIAVSKKYIYITNYNYKNGSYFIDKIDLESGQSAGLIQKVSGVGIAINTRYHEEIYISDTQKSGNIHVLDGQTLKITKTILAKDFAAKLVLSPDGKTLFAANEMRPSKITVIDSIQGAIIKKIVMPNIIQAFAMTPDGRYLYAVGQGLNSFCGISPLPPCSTAVYVIDTKTYEIVSTITIASEHLQSIAIAPDGLSAYVTSYYDNCIYVIDTQLAILSPVAAVVKSILVCKAPSGIAITKDSKKILVSSYLDASVYIVDVQSEDISSITVKEHPRAIVCS